MITYALYRSNARGRGSRLGTIEKTARGFRYVDVHGLKGALVETFEAAIPQPWSIDNTESEFA